MSLCVCVRARARVCACEWLGVGKKNIVTYDLVLFLYPFWCSYCVRVAVFSSLFVILLLSTVCGVSVCVLVPLLVVIHCTKVAMSRVVILMWLLSLYCRFLLCWDAGSALEWWVCYTAASDRSRSVGLV
jgi:hypothetical protein